jgi:two-component system alkaline phosphatase synthesis response regulator PhoP
MAKKILMIDDEADFVDAVRMRLEANGYEVIAAYDGDEGYAKAVKEAPDLILLDLVMPRPNGIETLSRIKSDSRISAIPVIILTAKEDREYILDSGKLGAVDYIIKPIDMQLLVESVDKCIPS